jgi:hypothetical protein
MTFYYKLEHLFLASFSNLVYGFQARQELTQVENLPVAPLKGRLLDLPTNTRLVWKGLPGANALAYYKKS